VTITLPDVTAFATDFRVGVVKVDAGVNPVTVSRSGANTINGGTGFAVASQWQTVNFAGDTATGSYVAMDVTAAGALKAASNLSDLADPATARTNLGLGTAAIKNAAAGSGDLLPANGDGSQLTGISAYLTGEIKIWPGASLPSGGWLWCDGAAVSRATYAALFAAIGTAFGAGDGSTTFNLPDLRGRAPFGKDDMGGSAANRITSGGSGVNGASLGATGGAETVTLTTAQMPSHSHSFSPAFVGSGGATYNPSEGYNFTSSNTGSTGGDQAHQNMPPALVLNFIIKI